MEEQTNKVMAALETLAKELKEMGLRMTGMETSVGSLQTSVDSLQTDVQKSQKNLEMAMTTVGSVEQEQIAMGRSVQQLQRASPPTAASLLINRTGLPTGPPLLAGSGVLGPNATTVKPTPTAPVGAVGASAAATTTQIPGNDTSHAAKGKPYQYWFSGIDKSRRPSPKHVEINLLEEINPQYRTTKSCRNPITCICWIWNTEGKQPCNYARDVNGECASCCTTE